jgi:hypothetical protein
LPTRSEKEAVIAAASREQGERERAYIDFLNRSSAPPAKMPRLRQPMLPGDFVKNIDNLDERIVERGVAVSRDKVLGKGRERFNELLAKDRTCRSLQRVLRGAHIDFTSWPSIKHAFAAAGALTTIVPRRTSSEQLSGTGADRDQARRIEGFGSLWKVSGAQPTIANIYAFRDVLESLLLGQSLLQQLSPDGRIRSYFFAGGKGERAECFRRDWLSTLQGAHFTLTLVDPLGLVITWLAGSQTPLPDFGELVGEWLNKRAPSPNDIRLVKAIWRGFLLGHREWALWDLVGKATRLCTDVRTLEVWRQQLARNFPALSAWHDALRGCFQQNAGSGTSRFDSTAYRAFIDQAARDLTRCVSMLLALALEEMFPGTTVARLQSWLLIDAAKGATGFLAHSAAFPTSPGVGDLIGEKLEAAFPGMRLYSHHFEIAKT